MDCTRRDFLKAFGIIPAGFGAGAILDGCGFKSAYVNTLDIGEGKFTHTIPEYAIKRTRINGKWYMALPLPQDCTGEIQGIPLNPGSLERFYLVPEDNHKKTIIGDQVIIDPLDETWVIANIIYHPFHNAAVINPVDTPQKTRVPYHGKGLETRIKKGNLVSTKITEARKQGFPTVIFSVNENGKYIDKEFIYISMNEKIYRLGISIMSKEKEGMEYVETLFPVERLPVSYISLKPKPELFDEGITRDEKEKLEYTIQGYQGVPIRAKIIKRKGEKEEEEETQLKTKPPIDKETLKRR